MFLFIFSTAHSKPVGWGKCETRNNTVDWGNAHRISKWFSEGKLASIESVTLSVNNIRIHKSEFCLCIDKGPNKLTVLRYHLRRWVEKPGSGQPGYHRSLTVLKSSRPRWFSDREMKGSPVWQISRAGGLLDSLNEGGIDLACLFICPQLQLSW